MITNTHWNPKQIILFRRRFLDVDLFLVQEVRVFFDGIKTDSPDFEDQYVRMLVDVSGPFSNKNGEDIQTFVTRPMSAMLYEYELETGIKYKII